MLEECIEGLNIKPDGIYVDGTLGGAGHSKEILKRLKKYKVKTIELGVQSSNEYVLQKAGRGHTFEDVKMHYEAGADYIGCGPFRFTTTKKNLSPILGLEGYRSIVSQMKEAGIHLPIVAIGGITFEDIPSIMATGVTGIALSGTILRADNPIEETRRIINIEKINNK